MYARTPIGACDAPGICTPYFDAAGDIRLMDLMSSPLVYDRTPV